MSSHYVLFSSQKEHKADIGDKSLHFGFTGRLQYLSDTHSPILTCDVMTSIDAMKRSAMMDTPRNMYMSDTK